MFAHASIRVKIADGGFHFSVIYECFASPSVPVCVLKRTVYIAVRFTGTHPGLKSNSQIVKNLYVMNRDWWEKFM